MSREPKKGDLVVCKIIKINPHSAFAFIEEYGKEGLIHISEIASGWVKDIKSYLKEGQIVVAKVIYVDENVINLSIKRVKRDQKRNKLREYKKEKGAEKALETVAKKLRQTRKFEEIKQKLKEEFGSITKVFEIALKNKELLKRVLNERWIKEIEEIAKKMGRKKEIEIKLRLKLKSYRGDGIEEIKKALEEIENLGVEIKYIAAPEYLVKFKAKKPKNIEKKIEELCEKIEEIGKKHACFESVEVIET